VDEHTLRVLEYDKVLRLLAAETAFSGGRELALVLRPATTFEEARARQSLAAEMRLLDQMGIDIPFAGASDIRPLLHAAGIAQVLETVDLVTAANALRATARARRVIERVRPQVPGLEGITDAIGDFRAFTEAVDEAIDARGEVADAASEQLASIRRELRMAQDRLEQRAQAALADAVRRDIAQEPLLTERNGRKVIPVKADFRGRLPGIVHDVSSSGATVFLEPMAVVEAGNRVRELQLAEEREVRRVLQRLTALLGAREAEATSAIDALARLDLLVAAVRLGRRLKASLPPPGDAETWLAPDGETRLVRARHPLLTGEVVPIDVQVGGEVQGLLITGPNTGGKTVALKTIGLLTLMAHSGLPIPCDDGSRIAVYEGVYADIGDEQSIEQSLSTFSSHMRNIKSILERARPRTLVLLDELGAGTDPAEGAALGRAIVEVLLERGATVVATTHHGELKVFAHNHPALRNASVEFDLETLTPTYHLTIGLPGQSNAIAIAERLGLGEEVLERAREQLEPGHFEFEHLLSEIRAERSAAAEAREREQAARRETERIRLELAERREAIERERAEVIDAAVRQAEDEVAAFRREVADLRRQGARAFDSLAAGERLKEMEERLGRLRREAKPRRQAAAVAAQPRPLAAGDTIHVRDIPQPGVALSEIGEDGKVEAQFGGLRMKVSIDRIDRVESPPPASASRPPEAVAERPHMSMELDLRGQRADEALEAFERYIDDAFRAGLPFVRIIHGKGTGALRAAIRDALRAHPLVRGYESAQPNAGGEGVTVAILAG
jgi:DNA mismatch repair protein MutS2